MHSNFILRSFVGLVSVLLVCEVSAQETQHILSIETNAGSYYYEDQLWGKVLLKAPALRVRTDLIPIRTYAEKWGEICLSNKEKSDYTFGKTAIPENLRKEIPEEFISREYSPVHYAVDGSDFCFPLNKGIPFKEFSTPIESVTPLPYHGKICVVTASPNKTPFDDFHISVMDAESGKEIDSFIAPSNPDDPMILTGILQWVNDRFILFVWPCRHFTDVRLIDLKDHKYLAGIGDIDPHNLDSAAVVNGKILLFDENGTMEYKLPR